MCIANTPKEEKTKNKDFFGKFMIIRSVKVWKRMGPQGGGDRVDYIIVGRGDENGLYKLWWKS